MKIDVKRKNLNWEKKLAERLRDQAEKECAVGIPAGKGLGEPDHTGTSPLERGIWLNFGTETAPRRPFVDESTPEIKAMCKSMSKKLAPRYDQGRISATTVLNSMGSKAAAIMKSKLRNGPWVPNSPETIRRKAKGGNGKDIKPGIDTGALLGSITFIVRKRTSA